MKLSHGHIEGGAIIVLRGTPGRSFVSFEFFLLS